MSSYVGWKEMVGDTVCIGEKVWGSVGDHILQDTVTHCIWPDSVLTKLQNELGEGGLAGGFRKGCVYYYTALLLFYWIWEYSYCLLERGRSCIYSSSDLGVSFIEGVLFAGVMVYHNVTNVWMGYSVDGVPRMTLKDTICLRLFDMYHIDGAHLIFNFQGHCISSSTLIPEVVQNSAGHAGITLITNHVGIPVYFMKCHGLELGCPRKKQKFISVRTKTNRNKICFAFVSVCFVKPKTKKIRFVSVFWTYIETTETNGTVS